MNPAPGMSRLNSAFMLLCGTAILLLALGCGGGSGSNNSNNTPATPNPGSSNTGSGGSNGGSSSPSNIALAYVGTGNSVASYTERTDGSLKTAAGSPYAGGGQLVVANSNYVFAANGDKTSIVSYTFNRTDGSLKQVATTNALSMSPDTISIVSNLTLDHSGQSLYVSTINGVGDNRIFLFGVNSDGSLTAKGLLGTSVFNGGPIAFSPDNHHAYNYGCWHANWNVTAFVRAADGTLSPVNSNAVPPDSATNPNATDCPSLLAVSAKNYVAIAYNDVGGRAVMRLALYQLNGDGSLTLLNSSDVAAAVDFSKSLAMQFDPSGTYLVFAATDVETFQVSSARLVPVSTTAGAGGGVHAVQWDNANHVFLLKDSGLAVYTNNNGTLTSTGASGATGNSLVVVPLQ